jgi:hypothetical protein
MRKWIFIIDCALHGHEGLDFENNYLQNVVETNLKSRNLLQNVV